MAQPSTGDTSLVAPAETGLVGAAVPAPPGRALRPRFEPEAVLVLRFSALGDVVLLAPALAALRAAWPATNIVVGTSAALAPLLANHRANLTIVPLAAGEGPLPYAARLRGALAGANDAVREDVVILDLHGQLRSLALRALLPQRWPRVVWHKRRFLDTFAVTAGLRTWRSDRLHADRYHLAVEALVGRTLPRGELRVWPAQADIAASNDVLMEAGRNPTRRLVGMSPGARWATKRWPAERFAAVARWAIAAGFDVAVQGSAEERGLCAEVAKLAPGTLDLGGRFDVGALMGFVANCAAFVGNDTGPMHVARASGVPTLGIFGSTDPGMFAWHGHQRLFADLPCSPCSFFGRDTCPKGHLRCLTDLGPEQAWAALSTLLLEGGGGGVGA